MRHKRDLRGEILAAAEARFRRFGYTKTTMAEIARECGMSPAHLYNFFAAKLDIAEEFVRQDAARLAAGYRHIGRDKTLSPEDRLRRYVLAELRDSFARMADEPEALEIGERIARERPLVLNDILAELRVPLIDILDQGVAAGAFRPGNTAEMAEMIQVATLKFRYPQMTSQLTLAQLEREAEGVLTLLLDGVRAR